MNAVSASFRKLQDLEQRGLAFEPGQIEGPVSYTHLTLPTSDLV